MEPVYVPADDIVETPLQDELILLDPRSGEMFSLNETGRRVWRALPAGEDALIGAVLEAYDVPREAAEADVLRLIDELLEAALIETRETRADAGEV